MCGKAIGHALEELHSKQQTGRADEAVLVPFRAESYHQAAWPHGILVPSNNVLHGAKELPEGLLLDLQA